MELLLVENDSTVCELLRYALQLEGHHVRVVENWSGMAEVLASDLHLDGIVSNIVLTHDTRPLETVAAAEARGIPVLLMTGETDTMVELDRRGRPYFDKPFRIERLLAWVGAQDGREPNDVGSASRQDAEPDR